MMDMLPQWDVHDKLEYDLDSFDELVEDSGIKTKVSATSPAKPDRKLRPRKKKGQASGY